MLVPAPPSFTSIVEFLARHGHDAKALSLCLLTYLAHNKVPDSQHELLDSHQAYTYRETIMGFSELLIQEMNDEDRKAFGLIMDTL